MDGSTRKELLLRQQLPGKEHHGGGAGAEWPYPAQKKERFPACCSHRVWFAPGWAPRCCNPVETLTRWGPCCIQPQMLQRASAELGRRRGPARVPDVLAGATELPARSESSKMSWVHLCPPGAGTRRALPLELCLQPSLGRGATVLAWESPADARLAGNGSCSASTSLGFKADLVKAMQTLPQGPPRRPSARYIDLICTCAFLGTARPVASQERIHLGDFWHKAAPAELSQCETTRVQ